MGLSLEKLDFIAKYGDSNKINQVIDTKPDEGEDPNSMSIHHVFSNPFLTQEHLSKILDSDHLPDSVKESAIKHEKVSVDRLNTVINAISDKKNLKLKPAAALNPKLSSNSLNFLAHNSNSAMYMNHDTYASRAGRNAIKNPNVSKQHINDAVHAYTTGQNEAWQWGKDINRLAADHVHFSVLDNPTLTKDQVNHIYSSTKHSKVKEKAGKILNKLNSENN